MYVLCMLACTVCAYNIMYVNFCSKSCTVKMNAQQDVSNKAFLVAIQNFLWLRNHHTICAYNILCM